MFPRSCSDRKDEAEFALVPQKIVDPVLNVKMKNLLTKKLPAPCRGPTDAVLGDREL